LFLALLFFLGLALDALFRLDARLLLGFTLASLGFFTLDSFGLLALEPGFLERLGGCLALGVIALLVHDVAALDVGAALAHFHVDRARGCGTARASTAGASGGHLQLAHALARER